ncbi:MAG: hypothetical protein A3E79_05685 [Burkholderiales bacterium RIFCSPHIGHO2_12_FULL_61_11]|nr:MAG: hypothetical protein A3E79_05685 [Burkholderiales bacterium RIFCSPHIGHO2_12_FULL_61_11]
MPTDHVEMMTKELVPAMTRVSVEILGGQPDSVDIIIDIKRENRSTAASPGRSPETDSRLGQSL